MKLDKISIDLSDDTDVICLKSGIYGVFGPEGSGITKLLKDLSTLPHNTANIKFLISDGENIDASLIDYVSYIPEYFATYRNYTVKDYLSYVALLKGYIGDDLNTLVIDLLGKLGIYNYTNIPIRKLDNQNTIIMRVILGSAFIGNPKIVLLDKLFSKMSKDEFEACRNLIRLLAKDKIVIVSSNFIERIEPICDKLLFLREGKIIACDTLKNNISKLENKLFTIMTRNHSEIQEIRCKYKIFSVNKSKSHTLFKVYSDTVPEYDYVIPETPKFEDLYTYLYDKSYEPDK